MVDQLDEEFESLVRSEAFSSLTQPSKMNALKALVNPNFSKEHKTKAVLSVPEDSKQVHLSVEFEIVSSLSLPFAAHLVNFYRMNLICMIKWLVRWHLRFVLIHQIGQRRQRK